MRIVFMGTPEFAVPSLHILMEEGYDLAGVVTVPDRPAGRGRKLRESNVKQYAIKKGLSPVLQPQDLKEENFLTTLKKLKADLFVVVAFRILPPEVFHIPEKGSFNLHASLLPDYRGAAPVNWAIIRGEKETGVTTFFIDRHVDTGKILLQQKIPVPPDMTAGELHDVLKVKGAAIVLDTVKAIESGKVIPRQQPGSTEKRAPKIFTRDCELDFEMSVKEAYDFIRGLSPRPAAWMRLDSKRLKIFRAEKEYAKDEQLPGRILADENRLKVRFPDGYILPVEVQLEGKKKMPVKEFLKGFKTHD